MAILSELMSIIWVTICYYGKFGLLFDWFLSMYEM